MAQFKAAVQDDVRAHYSEKPVKAAAKKRAAVSAGVKMKMTDVLTYLPLQPAEEVDDAFVKGYWKSGALGKVILMAAKAFFGVSGSN
jgi:hypothetical protein